MANLTLAADLIARICLVAMFPFSAVEKIWDWDDCLAQTNAAGLPGGRVMLIAAIAIEAVTPLLIVVGMWDRAAAAVLAGFCFVTAFLYHPFWNATDFWLKGAPSKGREHFWQFLKNFGLTGGLLLVVFAGVPANPIDVARHPLSSTRDRS